MEAFIPELIELHVTTRVRYSSLLSVMTTTEDNKKARLHVCIHLFDYLQKAINSLMKQSLKSETLTIARICSHCDAYKRRQFGVYLGACENVQLVRNSHLESFMSAASP